MSSENALDHWPPKLTRVSVPAGLLKAHGDDFLIILRLGAFANALQTQVQKSIELDNAHPAAERDRLCLFLASVGYFKEAVDHIEQCQPRLRHWLRLAGTRVTTPVSKWSALVPPLTRAPGSLYERVAKRVRDDVGVHLERKVFEEWFVSRADDQILTLYETTRDNRGRHYRASSDALSYAVHPEDSAHLFPLVQELGRAQIMMLFVTELVTIGALLDAGLEPRNYMESELE